MEYYNTDNIKKVGLIHYSFDELPRNFKEEKLYNYNLEKDSINEADIKQEKNKTHWRIKLVEFLESLSPTYDLTLMSRDEYFKFKKEAFHLVNDFKNSKDDINQWYFKIKNASVDKDEFIFKSKFFSAEKNSIFSCSIVQVDTSRPWMITHKTLNTCNDRVITPFDCKEEIEYLDNNNYNLSFFTLVDKNLNLYK